MTNPIVVEGTHPTRWQRVLGQCLAAAAALALLTWLGFILGVDLTTISLIYVLLVVFVTLFFGFWQASLTSLLAVACLDYFFTQPLFRFVISNSRDWVALGAFQVTAIVISRLSAKELRSKREAIIHRNWMEQLYELSRDSLLLNLHEPPGPQLVVLIDRIFSTEAVAMFDANLGRQDRMGEWGTDEEDVAKKCYLRGASWNDRETNTSQRVLRAGSGSIGALVVRGSLSPLVVDALASLAVTAMNRHQLFENEERAERASKTEQLRVAVLDAMAHEFKTPLNAVHTASSGLLESEGLTDPQRALTALIDDEIIRLSEICTQILMPAKLEAKQVGLQIEEVNVQELISEAVSSREADEARSRIHVALDDPSSTVRVDRALVVMILTQYVDNAQKYSAPNTVIEISARLSNGELLFSVHNIGPTIDIEDWERIFDRFNRSPQLKDAVPGTGVGLSAAKKAAHAHHGHVWVTSEEKEGTTFFLSLPDGARRKQ